MMMGTEEEEEEKLLRRVCELVEDAKLLEAGRLLDQLSDVSRQSSVVVELCRKLEVIRRLEDLMFLSKDWSVISAKDRVQVQYLPEPSLNTHNFKVSAKVNASMFNLVAVIYEVDLYHKWMPRLGFARELGSRSKFEKLVHLELEGVWPVSSRDCLLEGFGVDLLDRDALMVVLQSVPQDVPPRAGAVRSVLHIGGFYIQYAGEHETMLEMVFNFDPRMSVLPSWLLNFVTGHILELVFGYMEEACRDAVYEDRVKSNGAVYEHVSRILSKWTPHSH
jgi:hypothetical protein